MPEIPRRKLDALAFWQTRPIYITDPEDDHLRAEVLKDLRFAVAWAEAPTRGPWFSLMIVTCKGKTTVERRPEDPESLWIDRVAYETPRYRFFIKPGLIRAELEEIKANVVKISMEAALEWPEGETR